MNPFAWLRALPWGLIIRQLAMFLVAMWVIVTATFFMARAIPGGPFTQERFIPPAIREQMERRYNLHLPVHQQYFSFLGHLLTLDLGPSFFEEGRTVNQVIARDFPRSALLGTCALLFALALGIPVGVIAAMHHHRWPDHSALALVIAGVSVPSFIIASLLQYVFAYRLAGLLPASGLDAGIRSLIMPTLALSAFALAFIIRLVRASMIEVLQQDYITAARARGIRATVIARHHALRNALLPVLTYLGPLTASLFTGSFVIETIFDIPGLGRQFVFSIENRDYGLILGVTVFYSALLLGINMTIDLAYRWVDPRIAADETSGADS